MAENVTALYRLKFKDLASKGLLRTQRIAGKMGKALTSASVAIGGLAIGAGAAAIKIADAFANRADEINKFSRQVDISAESLQRLEFIANRQGASFGNVKSGIEKFTKSMGEFRAGTGTLKTVLDKVDPVLGKQLLAIRDNSDAFDFAVTSLSKYKDVQKKAAVAAALFGRSGGAAYIRIVDGGAEAFERLNAEAEKFRPAISAEDLALGEHYKDSIFNLQQVFKSLFDVIGVSMLPIMTKLSDRFSEFIVTNRALIKGKIESVFTNIKNAIEGIDFKELAGKAKVFAVAAKDLAVRAGALIQKAGGLKTVIIGLVGVFAVGKLIAFASALGGIVAVIGGPITLAIVGVVAAGVLLWKNWDKIKAKAEDMGINVDAILAGMTVAFGYLKEVFVDVMKVVGRAVEFNIRAMVKAFNWLRTAIGFAVTSSAVFRDGMLGAWESVKDGIGSVVKFIAEKIDFVLKQYNKLAGTALGARLGLERIELLSDRNVSGPAQSRAEAGRATNDLNINVDIGGRVEGADLKANVTTSSGRGQGASNIPLGRLAIL